MNLSSIGVDLPLRFGRRVPSILQTERAECGLACLAMVATYHGCATDLPSLRARFSISLRGMALSSLVQVASALGLISRPLRVELDDVDHLRLPCILHWDLNHFVVLTSANAKRLVIMDPAVGERALSRKEASDHFTGVAVELSPGDGFQRVRSEPGVPLLRMFGTVSGWKQSLLQIFVLALVLETLSLCTPIAMQWMLDRVATGNDGGWFALLAAGLALVLVTRVLVGAARTWAVAYLSTSVHVQWVTNLFTHLMRLPATYFESRHMGDILSRFGSTNTIRTTLTTSFIGAMLDGLLGLGTLTLMFLYSPALAMLSTTAALLYVFWRWVSFKPLWSATGEEIIHTANEQTMFLESIRGVQAIKLANAEDDRRARWLNALVQAVNRRLTRERLMLLNQTVHTSLFGLEHLAILCFGALRVVDGAFTVGMFFAFLAFRAQFTDRIGPLVDKWIDYRMLDLHTQRIADIALAEPESGIEDAAQEEWWDEPGRGSLSLRGIRFRYADEEPWILNGIDLDVAAGESIAIVGPSGCGKTTLMKILLGMLAPQEGEIAVDGVPLRRVGVRTYRAGIAAVMQDDQLFTGSIAQNIAFFGAVEMQRVIECASLAGIHDDIHAMPMRYETLLGDLGNTLSGGQRQRILLARALYKKPRILLLDEASSNLDVALERRVNENIRALSMTRIVIAHRPETIAFADRVITLTPPARLAQSHSPLPATAGCGSRDTSETARSHHHD